MTGSRMTALHGADAGPRANRTRSDGGRAGVRSRASIASHEQSRRRTLLS
jgi:hypothetical protein